MSDVILPHDYGIEDHERFMTDYRYNICHIVQVEKAFLWLRHKRMLDQYDEESIIREHNTSYLRAGHMIDILMRRGKSGFNALLEYIEYEYPEHFEKFTGKKPRMTSSEYRPFSVYRPSSSLILTEICNLNQHVLSSYIAEREQQRKLEHSLKNLENQIQEFQKELDMKNQQISELSQKNLEIKDQCKDLLSQWERDKQDKLHYMEECSSLRSSKDEYQEKCNQLMAEREMKGSAERASMKKTSVRDQNRSKLQQEVLLLRQELEKYKSNENLVTRDDWTNDMIQRQKSEMEKLVEEKDKVQEEREDLQEKLSKLTELCTMYERNNRDYKVQVEKMKEERDVIILQLSESQTKCEDLQKVNTTLKGEVSQKSSDLRNMISEAETYRPRLHPIKSPQCKVNRRTRINDSVSNFDIDDPYSHIDAPPLIDPASSSDDEESDNNARPPLYPRFSRGDRMERRDAILSKKKNPLVLYAPEEILSELQSLLLRTDTFQQCPYEKLQDSTVLATWIEGGSCIHYTVKDDYFLCIATHTLREFMHRESSGRILLSVPPVALKRMRNQLINPIILVVKYRDLENKGQKSQDETSLEDIKDVQFLYDKLILDRGDDLTSVVKNITIKCAASESSGRSSGISMNCNAGHPRVTSTTSV